MESELAAFVVDNCVTKTYHLDIMKFVVEQFLALSPNQRRVLLETSHDDPEDCLIFNGEDFNGQFERTLKKLDPSLQEDAKTSMSGCVELFLRVLNAYRLKNGTDTLGHGRCPW